MGADGVCVCVCACVFKEIWPNLGQRWKQIDVLRVVRRHDAYTRTHTIRCVTIPKHIHIYIQYDVSRYLFTYTHTLSSNIETRKLNSVTLNLSINFNNDS